MTAFWKYGAILVACFIMVILYGFVVGGEVSGLLLSIVFSCCFSALAICHRKKPKKSVIKNILKTTGISLLVVIISVCLYYELNRLGGTHTDTYETTVTTVVNNRNGSVTLFFHDPFGNEKYAEYVGFDTLKLVVKEDEIIKKGDTVQIAEYNGLFDMEYCLLIETE